MVDAAAVGVGPGEDDAVARGAVDGTDMLVVVADDFHMLANSAEHPALLAAACAPVREIVFEPRLVLAVVILVIAVEFVDLAPAPVMVVRIHCRAARLTLSNAARGIIAFAPAVIARHRPVAAATIVRLAVAPGAFAPAVTAAHFAVAIVASAIAPVIFAIAGGALFAAIAALLHAPVAIAPPLGVVVAE